MKANLFTEKDLAQLRTALASGQEIRLVRTLGPVTMIASTCHAVPVWGCDMLVCLQRFYPWGSRRQYYRSVDEMIPFLDD